MKRLKENLNVISKLLTRLQGQYARKSGAKLADKSRAADLLNDLGKGISALNQISNECQSPIERVPPGDAGNYVENWLDLALSELEEFNKYGSQYITSCSEALLKVHGVMNIWHANPATRTPIYFRGEHHYGHDLIPRLGRKSFVNTEESPWGVTQIELQLLSDFQARVNVEPALSTDIFGSRDVIPNNHPAWWAIMQHYDQTYGTRMLDVTSSIFCALYFACVGWNGELDDSKDGRLYLFPQPSVRGECENPDVIRGKLNDINDRKMNSAESYFTIECAPDTARLREVPHRNEREIAQDGFFVWQPKFWQPLNIGQIFDIRVARDSKIKILRELYSIGYTANRIVRGEAGRLAQGKLASQLGVK